MNYGITGHALRCLIAAVPLFAIPSARAVDPRSYAVELSANVQTAPPQITLKWTADSNATGYSVYRKAPSAGNWTPVTSLSAGTLAWTDVSVSNGGSYEYAVIKTT